MQALVPPPCSTGLDYTQSLQRRTAELEVELTAVRRRLNLQMDTTAQVEKKLVDALGLLSDRDIEVERLTFALKDSDNELESIRSNYENRIDELTTELNDLKGLYNNRLKIEEFQEEEIERLKRKNRKLAKVAKLAQQGAIDELWRLVKMHKEDLAGIGKELAIQGDMAATLERHDGLISKAVACIDGQSEAILQHAKSIDGLWRHVNSMLAHINTGSAQENP